MSKNIFEKYSELIQSENESIGITPMKYSGSKQYSQESFIDDNDSEDFITSKDIIKMKENNDPNIKAILSDRPIEIEEELHFKRYTKKHVHKYTDKEMEAIRESCKTVIVHDFSDHDIYHMSDEERAQEDSLNEIAVKVSGLKRTYSRVDKYIEAMRIVIEAWELLEKKENYLHDDKEFWQMVADGRIYHNRLFMPILNGMNKYNKDLIIQYISNPELDPKDLLPASQQNSDRDPWFNDDEEKESEEEEMKRLLSEDEVQYILDHEEDPEKIEIHKLNNKYIKGYDMRNFKKKKKESKTDKLIRTNVKTLLNHIQMNPSNRSGMWRSNRSTLITQSMFEPRKSEPDVWDEIYFDGSWDNENDLFLYDLAMEEYHMKQYIAGSSAMTVGDQEVADVFNTMEQEGMNVVRLRQLMSMDNSSYDKRKIKNQRKVNRKVESALIQRITKLNNNPRFKKLISKAENAINKQMEEY